MLWNSLRQGAGGHLPDLPGQLHPGGPPPATTKVSQASRSGPGGSVSAISKAPNSRRRIDSASSRVFIPGAHWAYSLVAEVRLLHPDGDHEHVVVDGEGAFRRGGGR